MTKLSRRPADRLASTMTKDRHTPGEDCNQCGYPSEDFREGVCTDCWTDNQRALDLHNAQYDRWQRMTDGQRADEIRTAALSAARGEK